MTRIPLVSWAWRISFFTQAITVYSFKGKKRRKIRKSNSRHNSFMFLKSVTQVTLRRFSRSVLLFALYYLNVKLCLNRSTVSALCKVQRKRTQHCWMFHVKSGCTSVLRIIGSCQCPRPFALS